MTIAFKKLAELVDEEVESIATMPAGRKRILQDLCKKVYMLEAEAKYSMSVNKLMEQMRHEIANVADQLVPKE
jgi:hypothetical protein